MQNFSIFHFQSIKDDDTNQFLVMILSSAITETIEASL